MRALRFAGLITIAVVCLVPMRFAHAGDCSITVYSKPAFGYEPFVHDLAVVSYGGNGWLLNLQTKDGGLAAGGQKTFNGDRSADWPQNRNDLRKTRTWSGLERWQCDRCREDYLKNVGYPYVYGDSNHAMARCTTAAGLGKLRYFVSWGCRFVGGTVLCTTGMRWGQDNSDAESRGDICLPATCESLNACGPTSNGCGVMLDCPPCQNCTTNPCSPECHDHYGSCGRVDSCGHQHGSPCDGGCNGYCCSSTCGQNPNDICNADGQCSCVASCTYPGSCGQPDGCGGTCWSDSLCGACAIDSTACGCLNEDRCACYGECGSSWCDERPWCLQCAGFPPGSGGGQDSGPTCGASPWCLQCYGYPAGSGHWYWGY